jgi:hypothetical protein
MVWHDWAPLPWCRWIEYRVLVSDEVIDLRFETRCACRWRRSGAKKRARL